MEKLASDVLEFGYRYSEATRASSRKELDDRFVAMNENFDRMR
jgi:hypothetical protein